MMVAEYVRTYHEERKRTAAKLLSLSSPLSFLLSIQSCYWSARSSDFTLR
jgi:hypothetical protein